MSAIQLYDSPGVNAVGVIDFSGAAAAGEVITIGGVAYSEADTEDFASGVWTNGSSAANSATSLVSAINGDERDGAAEVTAVVSDAGDSVVLCHDYAGTDGNLSVSADDGTNVTVEDMHDGEDATRKHMATLNYTVTDQDVLADEINIPLPFTPTGYVVNMRDTNGAIDAGTYNATIESGPTRLRLNFAGGTDPVAGDVISVVAFE